MAVEVSLIGDDISVGDTEVSFTIISISIATIAVSIVGNVSLSGVAPVPPPPGMGPSYDFSKASNSYYIATTAFG